jgi:hypothetical protein
VTVEKTLEGCNVINSADSHPARWRDLRFTSRVLYCVVGD